MDNQQSDETSRTAAFRRPRGSDSTHDTSKVRSLVPKGFCNFSASAPFGALFSSDAFGVGAVFVVAGPAVLNEEDDENNLADERNQPDKNPDAAAAGVVKPAEADRKTGNEKRKSDYNYKYIHNNADNGNSRRQASDDSEYCLEDDGKQGVVPVFAAPCPSFEVSVVVLQHACDRGFEIHKITFSHK